ncbi:peptide alpha-N-acetyltransferase complex A subunit NAT1 Ecym_3556 [Eremothecium cymbalariae DBVPG|uniref:N-terminal acetyltransferase A complex subunit NAT1 n=1 Tax=Eremothecium cymbalariae (strain CBS 270.75 / DBVPG 7215 / KCTC 17166 / NRRL Y-17582) TaxID=931890 RepID=G8JQP4_ERECY|nr:Hypothetical protein Ecym_3556 [Eremothecium cymbalariae DBVPG\
MSRRKAAVGQKPVALGSGRSKDDNNMLEALKLYENKSYKKSLKILDGILKKNSTHVESLALKGLNLVFTEQKQDAELYVKKAVSRITGTLASPICCHILGIYYRQVKQYANSITWFQASLDNGSTNKQIYRDISSLQSQERDYTNLLVSRKVYWETFMGYRANWTALAIAYDLNSQYSEAVNLLSRFEELAKGKLTETEAYEHNECLMYKNDLMYKAAGDDEQHLKAVLNNLDKIEPDVFDKYGWLERRAAVYMKLGSSKEAAKVYRTLIKRNPDNFNYYKLLEISLDIQSNNRIRKALYEKLETFYPRAEPPKFIPLTFIKDETELEKKLNHYIVSQLKRGVPATFCNVIPLYKQRGEVISSIAEKIVLEYYNTLDDKEFPIQYVWTVYYLAQHYLFLKDFKKAKDYIEKAIEHTPTLVELYILNGRILKHLGLLEEAAWTVEKGRTLDLQDRFINTKSVEYFLGANMIDKAVQLVSLFTKNDNDANGVKDLHLMEASWFIIKQAEAYYRLYVEHSKKLQSLKNEQTSISEEERENKTAELKELEYQTEKCRGLALKRFMAIPKIYKQFDDDKLDFHSYCMRKGTPRAYVEMLQWGDRIFCKPMFVRAMLGAAKIYFSMQDELDLTEQFTSEQTNAAKKANKKARKEALAFNKRKEAEKKQVLAYADDEDVFGETLVAVKSPLEAFYTEFYKPFLNQADDNDKYHLLEFQYQARTGKLALSLGALTKYAKFHGKSSPMVGCMILILLDMTRESAPYEDIAKKVAIKGIETEFKKFPLEKFSDDSFNWLEYLTSNYKVNLRSLLFLYQANISIVPQDKLKELIIESLSNVEPFIQNSILQYEL